MKIGISKFINKSPFKNWFWHPVSQLEEIRYLTESEYLAWQLTIEVMLNNIAQLHQLKCKSIFCCSDELQGTTRSTHTHTKLWKLSLHHRNCPHCQLPYFYRIVNCVG